MPKIEVDIHGMTVSEAKYKLERLIVSAAPNTEMTVIHGYRGGNALAEMVRKALKNKRIKQKILSMNPGETTLLIS
ncbi:MAG: Smr/MutS family protein [Eubacteriaceae bacterium]|nr:Smr/MutS family protein [Eubacteriaceae bacterium]